MIYCINARSDEIEIKPEDVELYLGYYGAKADPETKKLICECTGEFLESAQFKACYAVVDVTSDGKNVDLGFMNVKSKSLAKNLCGCEKAYVFAATTGVKSQRLINANAVLSPLKGTVTDCVGSAAIEAFCDKINSSFGDTEYLRPRFSPGYGDMPLETQKEITEFLQTKSKLALGLTESLMMSPSKSVTAIIGISKEKNKCTGPGCMICNRQNCPYS